MHPPNISDYIFDELLGDGCTGSVWLARYHGQTAVALKAFHSLAINRQLVSDALVRIYEAADHPGILKVIDFDLAGSQAYVAHELCAEEVKLADGRTVWKPRTLETLCGALPAGDAWRAVGQIADAMAFLHRKRIIHANLKPSNVLFGGGDSPRAMLCDFCQGLVGGIEQIDVRGSAFYAAPEQLTDPDHFFEGRAERWDVYRFGVTAFRLLTGRFPRLDEAAHEFQRRRSRELDLDDPIELDRVAEALQEEPDIHWPASAETDLEIARRRIIDTCLRLDPKDRYVDMREVLEAFRDAEHEQEHLGELEDFEEVKSELTAVAKGAKRRAVLLAIATAAAAGVATFLFVDRNDSQPDHATGGTENTLTTPPDAPSAESVAEQEARTQLAGALDDLLHSQAALDSVFEMIAARDAQGQPLYDLPDGALGRVLNYYEEFSNRHFGHPENADQVAMALNNAGELKMILGDFPGAVANLASAAEMLDDVETGGGEPGALLRRRARAYTNLSDAQSASMLPVAAVASAKQADAIYKQLADSAGGEESNGPRHFAASSLQLGRKMYEANQYGEAGIYVDRAASLLRPLEAEGVANEGDLATLAASAFEKGRIEQASKDRESAIKSQIEAIDRYLALIEARPEIDDYRFQLARAYGEAADLASKLGEPGESSAANTEATTLLRSLADASPEHAAYRYELARRLRSIAASFSKKDAAGVSKDAERARAEQEKVIVLLEDLNERYPNEAQYTYDLAIISGLHGDLLGEADELNEAIARGRRAVDLMQQLLMSDLDLENGDAKRSRYRHALAALYAKLGHHTERSGDKESALHCFEKALKQYETLVVSNPTDPAATTGVEWAEGRIGRLQ